MEFAFLATLSVCHSLLGNFSCFLLAADCFSKSIFSVGHSGQLGSSFLSLYTARPSFEYYRQVYFVHSRLQDESPKVTIVVVVVVVYKFSQSRDTFSQSGLLKLSTSNAQHPMFTLKNAQ